MTRTGQIVIELLIAGIFLILAVPRVPDVVQWAYDYPDKRMAAEEQMNATLLPMAEHIAELQRRNALIEAARKADRARIAKMRSCVGEDDYDCRDEDGNARGREIPKQAAYHPKVGLRCGFAVRDDCFDEQNIYHPKSSTPAPHN